MIIPHLFVALFFNNFQKALVFQRIEKAVSVQISFLYL